MVLHYIAERAGLLVEWAAAFDANILRRRDLYVIDIVTIPDRLEDPVGKAKDQDVLHRLLAQVVIDAEDLVFGKNPVYFVVQLPAPNPGRGQRASR